jgi:A/G-specific adenine glycosylase
LGIAENPKEKATNELLWQLAQELVSHAKAQGSQRKNVPAFAPLRKKNSRTRTSTKDEDDWACSHLNQSLMELGALVCTPRNPQCLICPVKKLCIAFKENRTEELPNLGKREIATARRFVAFVVERDGKFLVRQRPNGIVNGHLWEFPNVEIIHPKTEAALLAKDFLGIAPIKFEPLCTVKHSITRYRITLDAFALELKQFPKKVEGIWKTPAQMQLLAFTSAHRKILGTLATRTKS